MKGFLKDLRIIRVLILGLLMLVQAGCATTTEEVTVPVDLPESFSRAGTAKTPDRWWKALEDPNLTTLVNRAFRGNYDLKTAWNRLDQARAIARREGSNLYPSLDASASLAREVQEGNTATGFAVIRGGDGRSYTTDYTLGFTARYEVDVWGKVRARQQSAEEEVKATEQDLKATALSLSEQIAQAWYRVVERRGQLELLREQVSTNRQYVELMELRFQKGEASSTDVLQQRELLESTRTTRNEIQKQLQAVRHQLAVLIGKVPGQVEFPAQTELPDLPPLPRTNVPLEWLKQRPDLQAAFYRVRAADRNLAVAIAERYPQFSLSGSYRSAASRPSDLLENWTANLVGELTQSLIDGDRLDAEADRSRAVLAERINEFAGVLLTGVQEVEDNLGNEREQRQVVDGLRRQLNLARQSVQQLWDRYRNGAVDFLRVLDEVRNFQQLQRNLLAARGQLVQDRIDLYKALGGSWMPERPPGTD